MTKIYNFNGITGEFIHETEARLDPKAGTALVPANATTTAPPACADNEVAVWADDMWKKQIDHRGAEYWLPDGSHHKVTDIGELLPVDALSAPPPPSPEEEAAARLVSVKAACRSRIYAVASAETQMNMATAAAIAAAVAVADRTTEQVDILTGVASALTWVDQMRAQVVVLAADPDADFITDAAWPPVPAEALAVVAQF